MTDQPTLRDRIRRAICEASGFTWLPDELMEPDEYGDHADAVLAVLPAPVGRAAASAVLWPAAEHHAVAEWICCDPVDPGHELCSQAAGALRMLKTLLVDDPEAYKAAPLLDEVMRLAAPVDRAVVLREAADEAESVAESLRAHLEFERSTGALDVMTELRRMADEAQQPEEAWPSSRSGGWRSANRVTASGCPPGPSRRRRKPSAAWPSPGRPGRSTAGPTSTAGSSARPPRTPSSPTSVSPPRDARRAAPGPIRSGARPVQHEHHRRNLMLSTDQWSTIRSLVDWLDSKNGRSDAEITLRLLKITEEAGEVAQAWIGVQGQNPRKGITHPPRRSGRTL
ncbi:MazG-like family protein [Streptomyces sp. NPDC056670]|uniref:MazG-like family protein n=1 Tax=Streptomyces sp. NPDC056670 TaxID=3345904 RepID=UPI0036C4817B